MKKEQLNSSEKANNKGITCINEDIAWIIDEIKGIYNEESLKSSSNAEWFINEWNNYLQSIVPEHNQLSIKDIFIQGISVIENKYIKLNKNTLNTEIPLISIALVRWSGCIAEYFILGDCQLWINKNNSTYTITDNKLNTINSLLFNNIKRIKQINKDMSFEEINTYIKPTLIQNKSKANTENGYWTLSLNEKAICNALQATFPINGDASLLLVNRGCSTISNDYDFLSKTEVFETVEKYKLTSVLNLVRSIENNDEKGEIYPRLKENDNFSAVYLNFK